MGDYPNQGNERRLSADRLDRPLSESPGKATDPAWMQSGGMKRGLFGDFNFQKGSVGPLQSVPTS